MTSVTVTPLCHISATAIGLAGHARFLPGSAAPGRSGITSGTQYHSVVSYRLVFVHRYCKCEGENKSLKHIGAFRGLMRVVLNSCAFLFSSKNGLMSNLKSK